MTDEQIPPRKTLTLKRTPSSSAAATPRKRAGGRAKQVDQRARVQEQTRTPSPPPKTLSPNPSPTSGRGERPGARASTKRTAAGAQAGHAAVPRKRPTFAPHAGEGKNVREQSSLPSPTRGVRAGCLRGTASHPERTPAAPRLAGAWAGGEGRQSSTNFHTIFAPCPQGLEAALAQELQTLGFADATAQRAGCQFSADWQGVMRANLWSRLATRILVRVAHAPVAHEDALYALAHATPWEHWFGPKERLRVDTSAIRSPMQSLQFCTLRVKDAICDRLREREGARPDVDTVRPDARVQVFLNESHATLYLDTSGESLFKRGWRLDKGQAPLRENLASGLLALAGWQPQQALIDPFCGSGTIVIEAAQAALRIPPGGNRPLGFERLRTHDARAWQDIKDAARAQILPHMDTPFVGCDLDADMIAAARANARRAGLAPEAIAWRVGDALKLSPAGAPGWILTNPPYGERMDSVEDDFWQSWAAQLKRQYAGWQVGVISSDLDFPRALRLKPQRRIPVHNGALECRLFLFEMAQGSYRA